MSWLHWGHQVSGFTARVEATGDILRARSMFINSLRLTGDDAEELAEILYKTTPDFR